MFIIKAPPHFDHAVSITGSGGAEQVLLCKFRHRTRDEFRAFMAPEATAGRSDIDTVMQMLVGWDQVDTEFSREAVEALLQNHHQAALELAISYAEGLVGGRAKN